jgi:hypothetical protein
MSLSLRRCEVKNSLALHHKPALSITNTLRSGSREEKGPREPAFELLFLRRSRRPVIVAKSRWRAGFCC